jgi:TolB-like protein
VGAKTKKRLAWTIGSLTAIAVAVLVALNAGSIRNRSAHSGANGPVQSLAVLPFTDETGDAQLEYLDDGLTESLINGLSRLPQLKVMSRNAVFRYKGKNVDAQAAGNALKVDAVLTGTIRQLGDAIDINAELIDTRDNSQMWGQHYERKLADLASLQQELSVDISEQLRPKLSRSDQQQLQRGPTDNSEAYQLYLKGNYFWNKKTAVDHQRAIELYREAIEKDPKFALAYVGISNSYALMSVNSNLPPRDVLQKAKEAALQALAIDPNLPEAHTALGRVLLSYEYDFAGAEKELERANELNASDVNSHLWSVELLTAAGRFDEAFAAARRGIQVEPFSSPANGFLARAYYYAGQYEESIGYFRKALELDSHAWFLHLWFGMPLTAVKDYPAAIAEFDKTENVTYEPALRKIYAEAMSGDRQKAEVELEKFVQLSKTQFVPALHIARVYTGLGEKDQAFKWLDRAYEERDFLLIYLNVDPDFAPLRSDPGFATLVRRVGIPVANEQAGPHRK